MNDYTPTELITAIDIITTIHTRDHDELGFVIEGGASPQWPATHERGVSNGQYADAWQTLRCEVHKKGFADQKDPVSIVSRLKQERDELLEMLIWLSNEAMGWREEDLAEAGGWSNTRALLDRAKQARELIAKVEK